MKEFDFINRIKTSVKLKKSGAIRSIGDDCAILPYTSTHDLLATTDSLYEGVHFSKKYFTPWEIGARAMAVNISDICAMGGRPLYALVNIGCPAAVKQGYMEKIYNGISDYARNYGAEIIGGDTITSSKIFISVTLLGEVEAGRAMRRDKAKPGDVIFTTGFLGDSYAGLKVLSRKHPGKLKDHEYLPVKRHKLPVPCYLEGRQLLLSGCVGACMDISDGIMNDITRICEESAVGAVINADMLPVSYSCSKVAGSFGEDPADYALYGGEDFELLFTVRRNKMEKFMKYVSGNSINVFEAGVITGPGSVFVLKNGKKYKENYKKAWKHF